MGLTKARKASMTPIMANFFINSLFFSVSLLFRNCKEANRAIDLV